MFCRPIITDLHVQHALNVCKSKKPNSHESNRAWSKALRLIQMKNSQAQVICEGIEVEDILESLTREGDGEKHTREQ
jgi:hypothetical protein